MSESGIDPGVLKVILESSERVSRRELERIIFERDESRREHLVTQDQLAKVTRERDTLAKWIVANQEPNS